MNKILNQIIYLLLAVLLIELTLFLFFKIIQNSPNTTPSQVSDLPPKELLLTSQYSSEDEEIEALVSSAIQEIVTQSRSLPKSIQYTVWDKEVVAHVGEKILQPKESPSTKTTAPKTFKVAVKEKPKKTLVLKSKPKTVTHKKETKTKVVSKSRPKPKPKTSISQKIEKFAKAKLGKKYVWGAIGPNQFDCSGFTREVFRCSVGIKIPRVSRDQAKVGKYIKSIKDLKRGDLVFFDTEKKFTRKVNHVGIYLGKGNFIHASSAKKRVIITNFNKKPFYKRRFLWGRRLLKSKY